MTIERWQRFSELMSFRQATDGLFEDIFVRLSRLLPLASELATPELDVYQTTDEAVMKATNICLSIKVNR